MLSLVARLSRSQATLGLISGYVLILPHRSCINDMVQAPDVTNVNGVYYMYYAVSSFGSQVSDIGLATSTTMEVGSWTDHGSTGIASTSAKPYNAIDPNLVLAGSTYYLNFGSFWHDLYQVQMDATSPLTKGSNAAYNIAYNSSGTSAEEGSTMFYYSGYYYLLFSSGVCCGYDTAKPAQGLEYRIVVCRSTSATGGFVSSYATLQIQWKFTDLGF